MPDTWYSFSAMSRVLESHERSTRITLQVILLAHALTSCTLASYLYTHMCTYLGRVAISC